MCMEFCSARSKFHMRIITAKEKSQQSTDVNSKPPRGDSPLSCRMLKMSVFFALMLPRSRALHLDLGLQCYSQSGSAKWWFSLQMIWGCRGPEIQITLQRSVHPKALPRARPQMHTEATQPSQRTRRRESWARHTQIRKVQNWRDDAAHAPSHSCMILWR